MMKLIISSSRTKPSGCIRGASLAGSADDTKKEMNVRYTE